MISKKRLIKFITIILLLGSIGGITIFSLEKPIVNDKVKFKVRSKKDYFAIIEIPKINLEKKLYLDSRNNVDINLYIQENSVLPENSRSNIIIAGHSGNGKHAYFKDLYKVKVGDIVKIYYNDNLFIYEIKEIEEQAKTGVLYIKRYLEDRITLITCTKDNEKTQTIYYGILKAKQKV